MFLFISASMCRLAGGKTPDVGSRTYAHILREQQLRAEEQEVTRPYLIKSKSILLIIISMQ